ncbi:hypothetical protein M271_25810 [Streptomyces rapamycinicus NRRL 5491]|uniref:Integral membrane protein n=2 Tax=Streptomyces rapamycinicus TaxID=1226757 RepID=A0A0A0NHE1_STRRN|nr:hypothetical protein M271_25810 [Streptomyces rapamycinicus NRRL 5491]RLV80264.1 hypothetical protein D3C57_117805 [Streptomyces rapamycinicus NRRL 5491]
MGRWTKGIVVSAAAAHATYWVWESAERWESEARRANPDAGVGAGFIEGALATLAWLTLVPVLLWAGMRMLRERDNQLLVCMGSATWIILGTQLTEGGISRMETELFLLAFALLGGFLTLLRPTAPTER